MLNRTFYPFGAARLPSTESNYRDGLIAEDLVLGYKSKRLTQPLGFDLRIGELACLIGPNGAGKSTLLRTLAGMQRPLGGTVEVRSWKPHQISPAQRARLISVVLTTRPDAPLLTGYGIVALGRHPYTEWHGQLTGDDSAAVEAAIIAVGAQDYAHRPISTLSDGQAQKLMIARALAQEAPIMLLDEPTAFLDLPRRVEIVQLLRNIAHQERRAVLLTTHDLDLALRTADRLFLMSDNHLETGAPEDLVLSGAFERAFQAQGVAFDTSSGSFCFGDPVTRTVSLAGEGVAYVWTRRALERAGFAIQSDAALRVQIAASSAGMRWQRWHGEECQDFSSIYALIEAVTRETPNNAP